MSTRAARYVNRRKDRVDLDLNSAPPGDNRDQEGTSTPADPQNNQATLLGQSAPPNMIDVEAIDDDVVESSPRAFAEAKNNARRNQRRITVDVDLERTRVTRNKRRRVAPNQTILIKESVAQPAPPPPKEPTFSCPICMAPLVEEMSTKCGHIFCKACIRAAIGAQGKCPTCRRKVTMKELIRVFLLRPDECATHAYIGDLY
ncbi:RING/U-box superfamily protein [Prunus dulcis]|uniref:RING/U-box superfamily protein n=1 Tax=Prunus dulcis TaxID=3755 RepID=A0A4Y1S127_PRUDU|nr:RING/U-box superfamily protein [Prunus dulcis]